MLSMTVVSRQLRGEKVKGAEELRLWNRKPFRTARQKAAGIDSYKTKDGYRRSSAPIHIHPMPKLEG
jgi:hypothetical protein